MNPSNYHPLGYEKPEPILTGYDSKILEKMMDLLKYVGDGSDTARLKEIVENDFVGDPCNNLCEIAISYMRYSVDLRNDLEEQRMNGYY